MTGDAIARQREEDAAQFEDWSPWAGLLYVVPEWGVFELRLTCCRSDKIVAQIPGIAPSRYHGHLRWQGRSPPWHLPLVDWRRLKAALPAIKAAEDAYSAERRAADARHEAKARQATQTRIASLLKPASERTMCEMIEVIVTAYLYRDRRLSPWERKFAVDTGNRWHRYGDKIALTDKQRAQVARIHDKVSDTLVI